MKSFAEARASFDALLEQRKVLNAVHRSIACGNIMENTFRGFVAGFHSGADIVELDIAATTDGVFYLIHDGMEPRVLGHRQCVTKSSAANFARREYRNTCGNRIGHPEEALPTLARMRGAGLLNVDRSWRYWGDGLLEKLAALDMFDQLILKCPADDAVALDRLEDSGFPFLFIPIVRRPEEMQALFTRRINMIGAEILFDTENAPVVAPGFIAELKHRRIAVWYNAITMSDHEPWSNISAYCDDDSAVLEGPEKSWGRLIELGASIIQTDWPTLLHCYLARRLPGSRPALFGYES